MRVRKHGNNITACSSYDIKCCLQSIVTNDSRVLLEHSLDVNEKDISPNHIIQTTYQLESIAPILQMPRMIQSVL